MFLAIWTCFASAVFIIIILLIQSCVYPEPVDEVIACKQVIDKEFEGMLSCGLVEEENIEGPLIHFLQKQPEDSENEPGNTMKLTHQLPTLETTVTSCNHWCNNKTPTSWGECGNFLIVIDWIIACFSSYSNMAFIKVVGNLFHLLSHFQCFMFLYLITNVIMQITFKAVRAVGG